MERESVRTYSTPMLDVKIYKGPGFSKNGILDFAPFIKPTARHIPLCDTSSHPPSVHRSWPISEMARLRKRSLYSSSFGLFQHLKIKRFAHFFMHPGILRRCREWRKLRIYGPKPENLRGRVFRLIVPWHPSLSGLGMKINDLVQEWRPVIGSLGSDGMFANSIQVAYSLSTRALFSLCR